jgi:hypothetical protein
MMKQQMNHSISSLIDIETYIVITTYKVKLSFLFSFVYFKKVATFWRINIMINIFTYMVKNKIKKAFNFNY